MKKIFTLLLFAIAAVGFSSCNDDDNDNNFPVTGEGYISLDSYSSHWIYRMVVKATESDVTTYLLGGTNSVMSDGSLTGRGASVYFSYDATDASTLTTRNLTIGEDGAAAAYSTFVNYDSDTSATYTDIASGTIVVSKSGSYYRIRILGIDADGRSVSIAYEGYIYANFTPESDDDE